MNVKVLIKRARFLGGHQTHGFKFQATQSSTAEKTRGLSSTSVPPGCSKCLKLRPQRPCYLRLQIADHQGLRHSGITCEDLRWLKSVQKMWHASCFSTVRSVDLCFKLSPGSVCCIIASCNALWSEDLIAEIWLLNKKKAASGCLRIRTQVRSQKFMLDYLCLWARHFLGFPMCRHSWHASATWVLATTLCMWKAWLRPWAICCSLKWQTPKRP